MKRPSKLAGKQRELIGRRIVVSEKIFTFQAPKTSTRAERTLMQIAQTITRSRGSSLGLMSQMGRP
jgi:hypothetical protein